MAANFVARLIARDDGMSATINAVKKNIKQTAEQTEKLKKSSEAFDKIRNSAEPTRTKIRQLKTEMEKLAAQGLADSTVFNQMASKCKELQAQLNRVRDATRNAGAAAKQSGLQKMLGAGTAATGIMGLIGGASGDAAAKILQVQSAMATLQGSMAAFGGGGAAILTNPITLAGAAAVAATSAWVSYNKQMEETMRRTQQFTGLSGNELLSLRNGIKSVASTWGKEYNDVLATVDSLMAQYGMDGESALKVVRDGFVSGADDAGHMQEMISKYAGSFNDAGISASELVAIIGNTRSGIFSEEGMAVIQMGAKNIRDMSTAARESLAAVGINADEMTAKLNSGQMTTMQAIQQISAKLKQLPPQSAAVGAVIQDVFGKKGAAAGYQLVTALADVETNLDQMKKQTGEVGEATERLQEAHRHLEDAMAAVFMSSEGGFETMTTVMKAEVLEALAAAIRGFIDLYNESIVVRGGVAGIAITFQASWEIIKGILKIFMSTLGALAKTIEGVLTLDWDKIKEGWTDWGEAVLTTVADTADEISKEWDEVREKFSKPLTRPSGPAVPAKGTPGTGTEGRGTGTEGEGVFSNWRRGLKASTPDADKPKVAAPSSGMEVIGATVDLSMFREASEQASRMIDQLQTKTGAGLEGNAIMDGMQARLAEQFEAFRAHREKIKGIIDGMRGDTDAGVLAFVNLGDVMRDSMASASDKAATALGTVGASLQQLGADGPIAKVGAVMAAVGQAVLGFATASAQAGAQTGPWGWLAFVGAGLGTLAAMVSTIKGFNAGGIVGGNSFHGDRMLARVNAGEMILTRPQQGRLFDILDGGGGPMGGGGTVRFEISGDKLFGVLNNYNRKMGKVR